LALQSALYDQSADKFEITFDYGIFGDNAGFNLTVGAFHIMRVHFSKIGRKLYRML
jgi:hypothetical protein